VAAAALLLLSTLALPATVAAANAKTADAKTADAKVGGDAARPLRSSIEDQGIAVAVRIEPLDENDPLLYQGADARVRFTITDAHTGKPLVGLYPGAWLDLLPPADKRPEETCTERVANFLGGTLLAKPELDLNVYYVVALNEDPTLTVVDPLFGFGTTRLLDQVRLRSPGGDWVLDDGGDYLFVSLPDSDRVAIVETSTWEVLIEVDTGPNPNRLALQPDGRHLWVTYEGREDDPRSGVTVIDVGRFRTRADLATGTGAHDLTFSTDGRHALVSNRGAGTVSVIGIGSFEKLRDVAAGGTPHHLAWGERAGAAYVVDATGGSVYSIDPERDEPRAKIEIGPGLGDLGFAPDGRLAFVVHPTDDTVHIIDSSADRVVQTADVEDEPDQVVFSDELAYVRHRGVDTVLMIPLDEIGSAGRPVPVIDFPGGQHPPGQGAAATPAPGIVKAPGANAVLVSNAEDRAIYFYKEGMAAPMGHFRNYGHMPRAVAVVDRSLRESTPGVYETTVALRAPGDYQLALFVESPRIVHCFPVSVVPDPKVLRTRTAGVDVELLSPNRRTPVGREVAVLYRLTAPDGTPRTGLTDVTAVTFRSPGLTQRRLPLTELRDGVYELRFTPDEEGVWMVFLEAPSEGLASQGSPRYFVRAVGQEAAAGAE
jgi:DNA-binding beta-propeller fold protein YncE